MKYLVRTVSQIKISVLYLFSYTSFYKYVVRILLFMVVHLYSNHQFAW